MLSQTYTIARTTFIEALRQPVYFILVALSLLFLVFTTWSTGFSLGYSDSAEVSGDNKMLLELCLGTIFLAGTLLAGFIATGAVSREVDNKTILTIVSKPVPRAVVILGKYLGITGAILVATVVLLAGLLLSIRHGVLTAVSDPSHQPVIVLSLVAVLGALGIATWGNFFYGWNFCQTSVLLLTPFLVIAYVACLGLRHDWTLEPFGTAYKPGIASAGLGLALGVMVLTSVAVAASTRLNQALTITCCVVFLIVGLLSTNVIGHLAFSNLPVARIAGAEVDSALAASGVADRERDATQGVDVVARTLQAISRPGGTMTIRLKNPATTPVKIGDNVWYGPNPNGFALSSSNFPAQTPGTPSGLVVTALDASATRLSVRNASPQGVAIDRIPAEDDHLFLTPTTANWPIAALWGVLPNLQFYWLPDAVNQNSPIPLSHMALLALYAGAQVLIFLSLAVVLFQNRDVG